MKIEFSVECDSHDERGLRDRGLYAVVAFTPEDNDDRSFLMSVLNLNHFHHDVKIGESVLFHAENLLAQLKPIEIVCKPELRQDGQDAPKPRRQDQVSAEEQAAAESAHGRSDN